MQSLELKTKLNDNIDMKILIRVSCGLIMSINPITRTTQKIEKNNCSIKFVPSSLLDLYRDLIISRVTIFCKPKEDIIEKITMNAKQKFNMPKLSGPR